MHGAVKDCDFALYRNTIQYTNLHYSIGNKINLRPIYELDSKSGKSLSRDLKYTYIVLAQMICYTTVVVGLVP